MSSRILGRLDVIGEMAIVLGCVIGLVIVGFKVTERRSSAATGTDQPMVASVETATSGVRRRPHETLAWYDLTAGEPLYGGDLVFTGRGARAVIAFNDGTRLAVDEDSLVVVEAVQVRDQVQDQDQDEDQDQNEPKPRRVAVQLERGSVVATAGEAPVEVKTADGGTTELAPGAETAVDLEPDGSVAVEVLAGSATVATQRETRELGARQGAVVARDTVEKVGTRDVTLTTPAHNQRLYFQGTNRRILLKWRGAPAGAQVEVSPFRRFHKAVTRAPADSGQLKYRAPAAGTYYWRVVGADGKALSHRRKLVLLEDMPSELVSPAEGEVLVAPPGTELVLKWRRLRGVRRYVLEISRDPEFEESTVERPSDSETTAFTSQLPEGRYYWRVRANEETRGASPASEPRTFRILHQPRLIAPEAIDVKLEVLDEDT